MRVFTKESLEELSKVMSVTRVMEILELDPICTPGWIADCPFCDETALFISEGDDYYHCFKCDAHGDPIDLLMILNNMSFEDAIVALSEVFDFPIDTYNRVPNEKKERIDIPQELVKVLIDFVDDPHIISTILLSYVEGKRKELSREKDVNVLQEKIDVQEEKGKKKSTRKTKKNKKRSKRTTKSDKACVQTAAASI